VPAIRPPRFSLNTSHPLAQGLVFAGLGNHPGGGTLYDSSGYRHDGTLTNMDPASDWDVSSYLNRHELNFLGSSSQYSTQPFSAITSYPFSLSTWVYFTTEAWSWCLSLSDQGFSRHYMLGFATAGDGHLTYFSRNLAQSGYYESGINTANEWYHLVGVSRDSSNHEIWINGQYIGTDTADVSLFSIDTLTVGAVYRSSLGGYWTGAIVDPCVWDRGLTSNEIRSLADPSNVLLDGLIEPHQSRVIFAAPAGGNAYTLTAANGTYTLTGQAAALTTNRKLAAANGSYAVTGQNAGLSQGYKITAADGTYTVTGQDAGLNAARKLTAGSGTLTLTGQDAALSAAHKLTAANGNYTVTGQDASLSYAGSYSMTASSGTLAITGQDAGLTVARKLTASSGTVTQAGQDATLKVHRKIALDEGTFVVTGQDVSLRAGNTLSAANGTFAISGQTTTLLRYAVLPAGSGTLTLTGQATGLDYSGSASNVGAVAVSDTVRYALSIEDTERYAVTTEDTGDTN
jgi:hypothetical protein